MSFLPSPAAWPEFLRAKLQEKAEKTLTSLRNWDSSGAGMALQAMKDVFALDKATASSDTDDATLRMLGDEHHQADGHDTMGMDLKRGMELAVENIRCPAFSNGHLELIRIWLADVDGDGSWPQHLRAPYGNGGESVLERLMSIAVRPISPDGPLQAGPALD